MPTVTIQQAFDLAIQHHQAGRLAEAEALCRQILAVQPSHVEALHHLGIIAHQLGRHELAVQWMRQTIALRPGHVAAHSNLGEAYRCLRSFDEATASLNRALQLDRNHAPAYLNLGNVLCNQGRLDEAIEAYRRALGLNPDMMTACYNLGNALKDRGLLEEAVVTYRKFLQVIPEDHEAHNNLGAVLAAQGHLDEAIGAYRRALELKPDYSVAHSNLGSLLRDQGDVEKAVAWFHRAVQLRPHQAWVHSNLIYTLHFHPDGDPKRIAEEQERWNRRFGESAKQFIVPHENDRNPERRLRIGYISPDFREHVVGRNLRPLFAFHDQECVEIVCYSGVVKPDDLTASFLQRADQWRTTAGVTDQALAEMIRADSVDILVDLAQHMAGNRLPVFARQPAPVQVSFAGYPESTGVEAIRYRISDRWMEAGGSPGRERSPSVPYLQGRTETVFLLDSFWCYDPCGMDVEVNELPALVSGGITFGCLNNFCKVNDAVLRLWARVMGKAPDSRLVLLSGFGSHRMRTLDFLAAEGAEPGRVEFVAPCGRREYLERYHRLDVVLDTFPYNGHTTSLDALWMGVPVVSLAGKTAVSRAGLSQLSNLGLPELVAHSEDEYVEIAACLPGDRPRLAELRRTLRGRMEASVLMDAPRFARQIEAAYRAMWRRWCAESEVGIK